VKAPVKKALVKKANQVKKPVLAAHVKAKAKATAKTSPSPAKKAAAKPVAKPTAKKPAKAAPKAASKLAPKSVAKPMAKPVPKAAPKPAVKPAAKPRQTPAKAAVKVSKPAAKPIPKSNPVSAKTAPKKASVPSKSSQPVSKTTAKPVAKTVPKAPAKAVAKAPAVKPPVSKAPAVKTPAAKQVAKAAAPAPAKAMPAPVPVAVAPARPKSSKSGFMSPGNIAPKPMQVSTAAKTHFTMTAPVLVPPPQVAVKKDAKLVNNWKTKTAAQLTDAEAIAMPDSEYMNALQLAFFRLKLVQLKKDILNSAGETTEHLREDTSVVPDPADRATIEEEHALELRTRDRERKLLKKIEQSIARIDADDYGYCDETGEAIGVARLIARPTASLSLEAQQRRELKQKMFGD
jgi:DnaK suppressor protein